MNNFTQETITTEDRNTEYRPTSDEVLFRNLPGIEFAETYKTPTRSKLMLQKPILKKSLKKITGSMCPYQMKELIKSYKRVGKKAFSMKFARLLPRVTILHGPNGTGKSTLGVFIAKKLEKN